jgi:hypothetical protein
MLMFCLPAALESVFDTTDRKVYCSKDIRRLKWYSHGARNRWFKVVSMVIVILVWGAVLWSFADTMILCVL